jgi:ubiquinone/menaquinone biosynthesis C-methylase UbiE
MTGAERRAALQAARAAEFAAILDVLLHVSGDERALDVGSGTGALAFALASRVGEVVTVDRDPDVVERARAAAPSNVEALVGDGEQLPFGPFEFDIAASVRTLHHTQRPELLVAELARVTRPGGTILVADQLAPVDPLAAFELNRFERARHAATTRVLSEETCVRCSTRTGWCCAGRRSRRRLAASRTTSTSPAARARSGST